MGPTSKNSSGAAATNLQPSQTKTQIQPATSNGTTAETSNSNGGTVNRKKQKRRQKQAARQNPPLQNSTFDPQIDSHDDEPDEFVPPKGFARPAPYDPDQYVGHKPPAPHYHPHDSGQDLDFQDNYSYEDATRALDDLDLRDDQATLRSKKKKKGKSIQDEVHYNHMQAYNNQSLYPPSLSHAPPPPPPPPPNPVMSDADVRTIQRNMPQKDPIWDISTQEERARIKDFWFSLNEQERKSLVKIEKEAVLRKMKEQQKHSCSCSVCGRKRVAIEEELETLYNAYYSELQSFTSGAASLLPNGQYALSNKQFPNSPDFAAGRHKPRFKELADGEDDLEDIDEDDQDYSGDETDEVHQMHRAQPQPSLSDFYEFSQALTVKGNIITVTDELLKNDGRKFIDVMDQLAERRIQREEQATNPLRNMHQQTLAPPHSHADHGDYPDDEEDDPEEYDEDDDYDSQVEDEYEDDVAAAEEDDMAQLQRMEEGRRMFQIFAARMFQQRVLTAYREKVAHERQQKLIEELEAEDRADSQRDAKKARDAEKKKAKKQQQKQAKAEEKARKDQQKAAEEAAVKEAEAKKQEEQRSKREEQRKKKEAERKAQEDEKQKKEAERIRRQQEERDRQQELERKAREQKAEEKRRREEAKKQEKEEREAKDKATRDEKMREDEARKEKLSKSKSADDGQSQKQKPILSSSTSNSGIESGKRPSIPAIVALPPTLKTQKSYTGQFSPGTKVATPTLPKPPTPVRSSESSGPASQRSNPQSTEIGQATVQTTPPKPQAPMSGHPIHSGSARTPHRQSSLTQNPLPSPHGLPPPPGMTHVSQHAPFTNMTPGTVHGFQPNQGSHVPNIPPGMHFPPHMPHSNEARGPNNPRNFIPPPPPGSGPSVMGAPGMRSPGQAFSHDLGSPFHQHLPNTGPNANPPTLPTARDQIRTHSRQPSTTYDGNQIDSQSHTTQPIARPAPIKRPASTKPNEGPQNNTDLEDSDKHLGSKALLDDADADEPLPMSHENKRPSVGAPGSTAPSSHIAGGILGSPFSSAGAFTPLSANTPDSWQSHAGFAQSPAHTAPGWGGLQHGLGTGWGGHNSFNPAPLSARPVNQLPPQHLNPRRLTSVRIMVSQACQRLNVKKGHGYHDAQEIMRQIESFRPPNEGSVQYHELKEIVDTEGDAHNGGGSFTVTSAMPNRFMVRWDPDTPMAGLGRIGSGGGGLVGQIGSPITPNGISPLGGGGAIGSRRL